MGVYLDSAATTKPKKEVIDAMMPYLTDEWYNPSSLYKSATNIKNKINEARATIAKLVRVDSDEIYFCSSASEANNWAIQGFVNNCISRGKQPVVITSVIEHKSIMLCVENLHTKVHYIGVDNKGNINIKQLEKLLEKYHTQNNTEILVTIQYANNEIGTVQDIVKISKLAHQYNAIFHTDAVQIFGKIFFLIGYLNDVDMMSVSGHKFGCPKGIAFLYKKNGIKINPLIYGTQENNMRGGTENVPYIIGLAKAIEYAKGDFVWYLNSIFDKKEYIMHKLYDKFDCKFNNPDFSKASIIAIPNIISITFQQNISAESLVYMLDMGGIQISTGSACNSHSIESSYVLKAIGLSDEEAQRTIRISFDDDITKEQIDEFVDELEKCIKLLSLEEVVQDE